MFLSVQQAARRLGVSPVTIRRWTATGFLPCTRTAGGHRRIDEHDIDDLAKAIGGSNHLAAQLAREREVDVLINTSIALAVQARPHRAAARDRDAHDQPARLPLLRHLRVRPRGRRDAHPGRVRPRRSAPAGRQSLPPARLPAHAPRARASRSPPWSTSTTRTPTPPRSRSCAARATAACSWCRSSCRDAASACSRSSTRSARAQYSRQELRLAEAIAGQAAVAIQNAKLFAERRRSDEDVANLREALARLTRHVPDAGRGRARVRTSLAGVAAAVCDALGAISCVASMGGESAGAFGAGQVAARRT